MGLAWHEGSGICVHRTGPRWQHWGLQLKGLCTPSPWYLAEACKLESHGSSRQEKGCDKGQRSALRHQASAPGSMLLLAS